MIIQHAQTWWQQLHLGWQLFIQLFVIALLILILNQVVKYSLRLWVMQSARTKNDWDDILAKALSRPLRTVIWIIGLMMMFSIVEEHLMIALTQYRLDQIFSMALTLSILWFGIGVAREAEKHYIHHPQHKNHLFDNQSIHFIARLVIIIFVVCAILVILGIFKVPLSGLLTFGGVGGAILAFSAKDMMANFFGGLMIYFGKPFSVGDWISSPDKPIEGTVEYIGWRMTRIRSFDQRPIYVPNAIFSTAVIVNPSRMNNRRIKQNIGVRYDDAERLPQILTEIRSYLTTHPDIDQQRTTLVNIMSFDASSITFQIYTFTKTTVWADYQMIQDRILLHIEKIIRQYGAECAFPTTTLHVPHGVNLNNKQEAL